MRLRGSLFHGHHDGGHGGLIQQMGQVRGKCRRHLAAGQGLLQRLRSQLTRVTDTGRLGRHPQATLFAPRLGIWLGAIQTQHRQHLSNTVDTQITQGAVFQADQGLARQAAQVRQLRLGQAQLGTPGANDAANIDQVHGWHRP